MTKLTSISKYATAYAAWILSFLLWFWFIILGRDALSGLLGAFYIQGKLSRDFQARLLDRVFLITAGLIWLVLMIVVEQYFRVGVKKGTLARRIGRVIGPEMILIFIADLILFLLVGVEFQPWPRWLLLIFELLAGASLIWLGWRARERLSSRQT